MSKDNWVVSAAKCFDFKHLVTVVLFGFFGWAFSVNPADETMQGAILAAFAAAWGFWIGSSRGAGDANNRADKALDVAAAAVSPITKTTTETTTSGPTADPEQSAGDRP